MLGKETEFNSVYFYYAAFLSDKYRLSVLAGLCIVFT